MRRILRGFFIAKYFNMNGYELSRKWFDWSFENPERINPNHTALYFFIIEHCNRLGWKEKFGLPTTMAKEAIGIRSYNTYINTLNDLVEFGFINLIEKSKNQYSSNIVALSNFDKAPNKALDKALIKHTTKQGESISSIDKQETNKQITIEERKTKFYSSLSLFVDEYPKQMLRDFFNYWSEHGENDKKLRFEKEKTFGIKQRLSTWHSRNPNQYEVNQTDHLVEYVNKQLGL
jgi:hypothetical protein